MPIFYPPPRYLRPSNVVRPLLAGLAGLLAGGALASADVPAASSRANSAKITANRAAPRSPSSERLACSFHFPICVQGTRERSAAAVALIPDLERAWRAVTFGLALPEPDVDLQGIVRVELRPRSEREIEDEAERAPTARTADSTLASVELTREHLFIYDRAFATLRVEPSATPGCARDHALANVMARASLGRASPALVDPVAEGMAAALADLAVPCAADDDARFLLQQRPQRSAIASKLLWGDLDATYGASPGALLRAISALIPTKTSDALPPDEPALPDPFSVLHTTFDLPDENDQKGRSLEDVLLDIAVRRLYISDGRDLTADWHVPWPAVPRRLAMTPIEPLGATYLVVDLTGADAPADLTKIGLRVEAEWEQHAELRFALVKLDVAGHPLGRMNAPVPKKFSSAQLSMADLKGATSVVIVVTNTGDHDVPLGAGGGLLAVEPHASLFTLAAE